MTSQDWTKLAHEISREFWERKTRIDLTTDLSKTLRSRGFDLDDHEVLDAFDTVKKTIRNDILERIEKSNEDGLSPRYKTVKVDPDLLVPLASEKADRFSEQLVRAVKELSTIGFEAFSVYALRMAGVEKCYRLRGTKEEGIDFYGVLGIGNFRPSPMMKGMQARILGQAKSNLIPEERIRMLSRDSMSFDNKGGLTDSRRVGSRKLVLQFCQLQHLLSASLVVQKNGREDMASSQKTSIKWWKSY